MDRSEAVSTIREVLEGLPAALDHGHEDEDRLSRASVALGWLVEYCDRLRNALEEAGRMAKDAEKFFAAKTTPEIDPDVASQAILVFFEFQDIVARALGSSVAAKEDNK